MVLSSAPSSPRAPLPPSPPPPPSPLQATRSPSLDSPRGSPRAGAQILAEIFTEVLAEIFAEIALAETLHVAHRRPKRPTANHDTSHTGANARACVPSTCHGDVSRVASAPSTCHAIHTSSTCHACARCGVEFGGGASDGPSGADGPVLCPACFRRYTNLLLVYFGATAALLGDY